MLNKPQVNGTVLILYIGLQQQTGVLSVGIDPERSDLLFAGIIVGGVCILFYIIIVKRLLFRNKEKPIDEKWHKTVLSTKNPVSRILFIVFVSLAAISEELVYRGYFILTWGHRTNFPLICAIVSSIVFILLHLDRGKKAIPYYTTVTIFFVIPTLYTNTILVSMGMHLYINIGTTIAIWLRAGKKPQTEQTRVIEQSNQNTTVIPAQKTTPNSVMALILFISSWIAIPFSLFFFAIPSIIIIILAICDMIRIKKSHGKITGIGFCIATILISTLPMLALAIFFSLPYVLGFLFST